MNTENICKIEAIAFLLLSNITMLLGADFPPPHGFIWIVITSCIIANTQYFYSKWLIPKITGLKTLWITCLFFACIGAITALLFALFNGGINKYIWIWIVVVTSVFIVYGFFFWIFNRWISNRFAR